jgi:hypothetical protein
VIHDAVEMVVMLYESGMDLREAIWTVKEVSSNRERRKEGAKGYK